MNYVSEGTETWKKVSAKEFTGHHSYFKINEP